MHRILPVLIVLFVSCEDMYAQKFINPRIKPYVSLDSYNSFVGDKGANAFGFKLGVEWDRTWRFAAGYNKVSSDIVEYKAIPASEEDYAPSDTVKAILKMHYFPLTAEYVFYHKDPWMLTAPLSLGYGRSYFEYFDKDNNTRKLYNHGVLVADLIVTGQYRFFPWFGAGLGLGYRVQLVKNPDVDTKINSPIYSVKVKFYLNAIASTLFPSRFPPQEQ